MNELLNRLEMLTKVMAEELDLADCDSLLRFVDERGRIINQINTLSDDYPDDKTELQIQLDRILQYDPILIAKMFALKSEAEQGLNRTSVARKQNSTYDVEHTVESVLYDRRK
jgi:hypothetical protein